MTGVEYFTRSEVAGQFFVCAPYRTTLSTAACAARYQSAANRPPTADVDLLAHCRGCTVGAAHAGETVSYQSEFFGLDLCVRCRRRNFRRLIRGAFCISCFNREREYLKGRNAKGTPVTIKLYPQTIGVIVNYDRPDRKYYEITEPLTRDAIEFGFQILRVTPGRTAFCRPLGRPAISVAQLSRELRGNDRRAWRGARRKG